MVTALFLRGPHTLPDPLSAIPHWLGQNWLRREVETVEEALERSRKEGGEGPLLSWGGVGVGSASGCQDEPLMALPSNCEILRGHSVF